MLPSDDGLLSTRIQEHLSCKYLSDKLFGQSICKRKGICILYTVLMLPLCPLPRSKQVFDQLYCLFGDQTKLFPYQIIIIQIYKMSFFQILSQITSLPDDFVRICCIFFINIILSYFFRFIDTKIYRLLYSMVFGILFLFIMVEQWTLYVIGSGLVAYTILAFTPSKKCLIMSALVGFPLLLFIHVYRVLYDYMSWKLDCSVMQMMMTTRIIYYGYYKYKNQDYKPRIMEYLAYILFFPSILIGPTFDFGIFQRFINLQQQYKQINFQKTKILQLILQGMLLAVITAYITPRYPIDWLSRNQFYLDSPFLVKFFLFNLLSLFHRLKFYTAWAFFQAAVDNSGVSYSKSGDFSEVVCGSFMTEIEPNPRLKTQYWNSSIQKWLRICVFEPSEEYFSKKWIPTALTFLTSAVWHGIYITYYITFFQWGLANDITKSLYRARQKFRFINKLPFSNILLWTLSFFMMNYVILPAVILDLSKAIIVYNSLFWLGNILILGLYLFFVLTGWNKSKKQDRKQS